MVINYQTINQSDDISEYINLETHDAECRICYEIVENPVEYCNCKGTQGYIHEECLLKSIPIVQKIDTKYYLKCELCKSNIEVAIKHPLMYYVIWYISFFLFLVTYIYFMLLNNIKVYDDFYEDHKHDKSKLSIAWGTFLLISIVCVLFIFYFVIYWFFMDIFIRCINLDKPKITLK